MPKETLQTHLKNIVLSKKASFWRRVMACIIDAIVISVPSAIVTVLLDFNSTSVYVFDSLLFYSYNILMDYFNQGTFGKLILNIQVTDLDGQRPTLLSSSVRNFTKVFSGLPLGLGFFMILAPHVRQTIHDKLSGCLVVQR